MKNKTILNIKDVKSSYGTTQILQGVNLQVNSGEIVCLIGRNGVGKTTTMRSLMGQLTINAGVIELNGLNITKYSSDARARAGIGYVPQGREVFPRMTVAENLIVGELIGGSTTRKSPEMVYEYFPRLAERKNQLAGTMSGGEQQQLAIGRALIGNPDLLLLDEPSEGIQPSIVQLICDVLKQVRRDLGTTIFFVEQNLDTILDLGERAYVMDKGIITSELQNQDITAENIKSSLTL